MASSMKPCFLEKSPSQNLKKNTGSSINPHFWEFYLGRFGKNMASSFYQKYKTYVFVLELKKNSALQIRLEAAITNFFY